ncbi:MAG: metal ABC transporter permease [Desulfobacterales bacterium]|nr:metal ABC transporter permease [Desulfobacterales bacterium]
MEQIIFNIIEALKFGFIQRALIVGSLIAVCCGCLGVFLVLRRLSLIGEGLAHFSFATIGFGLVLNVYPLYVAIPLTIIFSLLLFYMAEKANLYGDTAIGLISSLGIAIGVMLASLSGGFNVDLFSYLFGDILAISKFEALTATILSIIIILIVILFYHDLFVITFDEEFAHVLGVKPKLMTKLLLVLTSITVVIGIKVVGTMLISSLIISPSVTALQIAKGFKTAILISTIIGVFSVISGIILSYMLDLPAGASIVILNFCFFIIAFSLKRR